jgi:hypothetical protein
MHAQVLFLIGNLVESIVTISYGALERLLTCVDPHVVEEIMPFFEQFFASEIIFFTEKGALCSLSVSIIKLYLSKVSCRRNMQTAIEFFQIDVLTSSDLVLIILRLIELLSDPFNNFKVPLFFMYYLV